MEVLIKIAHIVTTFKIFKGADALFKINLIVKELFHVLFMI